MQADARMRVAADGTVVYKSAAAEVGLRALTDKAINQQFSARSGQGLKSTNPFTYGNTRWMDGEERGRFVVFLLSVYNRGLRKMRVDPAKMVMVAQDGREYGSLSMTDLGNYFRSYVIGFAGVEHARYRERTDVLRRTLFKSADVFLDQRLQGYVVFPVPHHQARVLTVTIHGIEQESDQRQATVEIGTLRYRFTRDIGRVYEDGRVVVTEREK